MIEGLLAIAVVVLIVCNISLWYRLCYAIVKLERRATREDMQLAEKTLNDFWAFLK